MSFCPGFFLLPLEWNDRVSAADVCDGTAGEAVLTGCGGQDRLYGDCVECRERGSWHSG